MISVNFFLCFAILYGVFLGAGLLVGLVLDVGFAQEAGLIVNVISFFGAFLLSVSRPWRRFVLVSRPLVISVSFVAAREKLKFSLSIGLIAVAIDSLYYAMVSFIFTGALQLPTFGRLLLLAGAYAVFAFTLINMMQSRPSIRNEVMSASGGPQLVETFKALSDADKSVIVAGAENPGSPMLTTKGSANDLFWSLLSEVKWTEKAELPEGISSSDMADNFVAWSVTPLGAVALPTLFRKAGK